MRPLRRTSLQSRWRVFSDFRELRTFISERVFTGRRLGARGYRDGPRRSQSPPRPRLCDWPASRRASSFALMQRRLFLTLGVAACTLPLAGEAAGGAPPSGRLGAAGDSTFLAWLDGFYARQLADGWSTSALAGILTGLSPAP